MPATARIAASSRGGLGGGDDDAVELLVERDLVLDGRVVGGAARVGEIAQLAQAGEVGRRDARRGPPRRVGLDQAADVVEVEQVGRVERAHHRAASRSMSTSPSRASSISASRTGVRDVRRRSASGSARSREPGASEPVRIASRSSSWTRDALVVEASRSATLHTLPRPMREIKASQDRLHAISVLV